MGWVTITSEAMEATHNTLRAPWPCPVATHRCSLRVGRECSRAVRCHHRHPAWAVSSKIRTRPSQRHSSRRRCLVIPGVRVLSLAARMRPVHIPMNSMHKRPTRGTPARTSTPIRSCRCPGVRFPTLLRGKAIHTARHTCPATACTVLRQLTRPIRMCMQMLGPVHTRGRCCRSHRLDFFMLRGYKRGVGGMDYYYEWHIGKATATLGRMDT